jgi:hypothetical protein
MLYEDIIGPHDSKLNIDFSNAIMTKGKADRNGLPSYTSDLF